MGLWIMGWVSRVGLVSSWTRAVPVFNSISERFISLGSDCGGMQIEIKGFHEDGNSKSITWHLNAKNNHGPEIPCTPAIILARKLARDEITIRGALPCLGLVTIEDFDREVETFEIDWEVST